MTSPRHFYRPLLSLFATLSLGLLAASPAPMTSGARISAGQGEGVDVTYVANEGFLISSAGRKILIDSIFTEGFRRFPTPSEAILNQQRNALPPFDHIDAVLLTHHHPDHLNPGDLIQHLAHSPKTLLIGTTQMNEQLKLIDGFAAVAKQVVVVPTDPGLVVKTPVQDLEIKSMYLQHLSDTERKQQNLGFVFSLGKIKLFHVGDAGPFDVAEYKNLKLDEEAIDVAIVNCYWFDEKRLGTVKQVIGLIKPKAIVVMHTPSEGFESYRQILEKMADLPPTYMPEKPMESIHFTKVDGKLAVDRSPLQR